MTPLHSPAGTHVLVDATHADAALLNDPQQLLNALRAAVAATGATVLREVVEQYAPQGVTAMLVLAESHASLHTYPEHRTWMADVFTCGHMDPSPAASVLIRRLGGRCRVRWLERGAGKGRRQCSE